MKWVLLFSLYKWENGNLESLLFSPDEKIGVKEGQKGYDLSPDNSALTDSDPGLDFSESSLLTNLAITEVSKCNHVHMCTHIHTHSHTHILMNEWRHTNQITNGNPWKFKCTDFFGSSLLSHFLNGACIIFSNKK